MGVTTIGTYAFKGCSKLTNVTTPGSVTEIGDYAFSGCTRLTSIVIGDGVTTIGTYAFEGCSKLTSVTIPGSVTKIGKSAFYRCTSLTGVTFVSTDTWYKTISANYSEGVQIDVTDESANATYFKSTYKSYYWYKE